MTVNKKPNVLDKIPPKGRKDAASPGTNASANAANNNVTSSFVSGITVNIFFFLYFKNNFKKLHGTKKILAVKQEFCLFDLI